MDADILVDARPVQGLFKDGLGTAGRVGPAILPLEQVFLRPVFLEIGAELFQNAGGQGNITVLLALGPPKVYLHVGTVDVLHLKCHQFAHAQAHAITKAQHGVVLQVRRMDKKPFHILRAEVLGQGTRFFGPWYFREEFFPVQDLFHIELDGVESAVQGGLA